MRRSLYTFRFNVLATTIEFAIMFYLPNYLFMHYVCAGRSVIQKNRTLYDSIANRHPAKLCFASDVDTKKVGTMRSMCSANGDNWYFRRKSNVETQKRSEPCEACVPRMEIIGTFAGSLLNNEKFFSDSDHFNLNGSKLAKQMIVERVASLCS